MSWPCLKCGNLSAEGRWCPDCGAKFTLSLAIRVDAFPWQIDTESASAPAIGCTVPRRDVAWAHAKIIDPARKPGRPPGRAGV